MEAMTIASTAIQALGAIQQGKEAQSAKDRNAQVMETNAANERSASNQREEAQRRQARMVLGQQRAAFAQSGTGIEGSAADVMQQSAADAELDALTMRYEGDMRASGLMAQAEMERYEGRQARKEGKAQAIRTILSGAAKYGENSANKASRDQTLKGMK